MKKIISREYDYIKRIYNWLRVPIPRRYIRYLIILIIIAVLPIMQTERYFFLFGTMLQCLGVFMGLWGGYEIFKHYGLFDPIKKWCSRFPKRNKERVEATICATLDAPTGSMRVETTPQRDNPEDEIDLRIELIYKHIDAIRLDMRGMCKEQKNDYNSILKNLKELQTKAEVSIKEVKNETKDLHTANLCEALVGGFLVITGLIFTII